MKQNKCQYLKFKHPNPTKWVAPPWWIPKALPLQHNRCSKTKKYGSNERTDQTPEKELSDEEITNLSEAEFKTLVVRMLTEMIQYGHK